MTKTILLGMVLAGIFAISAIAGVSAFHATWQTATGTVVEGDVVTTFTVNAADTIPAHTKDLAGYAFIYPTGDQSATVFALTTHHGVKDSTQRPNQWHAHNIALSGGAGNAEFCVADIEDAPFAKINVIKDTLSATLPSTSLQNTGLSYFAAFDIIVEPLCDITDIAGSPSGLRLGVDAAP